jgi:hypothetical protein
MALSPALVRSLALLALAFPSSSALAQAPVPPEAISAMAPVGWLAGQWSGEGTIHGPDGPRRIHQTEDVRTALEGALLIVGAGRVCDDGQSSLTCFGVFSPACAGPIRTPGKAGGSSTPARRSPPTGPSPGVRHP